MHIGKVILAGAGPGDPELITVKAAQYLAAAHVVICDRLVSETLLNRYVQPGTPVIYVGKEGYAKGSTPQADINELLRMYYHPDQLLVRLKGGDTAFFSNILDELITLTDYNIPYEIVPGITAASGASAYCGLPLTARGYADAVRFITYHHKTEQPESYWQELADTRDTLVCYMSGSRLREMIQELKARGIQEDKQIAVIEQATTPFQKTTIFDNTNDTWTNQSFQSPTLIIIGRVVQLYHRFQWKENNGNDEPYFRPGGKMVIQQPLSIFYKKQHHVIRNQTTFLERAVNGSDTAGTDLDERIPVRIAFP